MLYSTLSLFGLTYRYVTVLLITTRKGTMASFGIPYVRGESFLRKYRLERHPRSALGHGINPWHFISSSSSLYLEYDKNLLFQYREYKIYEKMIRYDIPASSVTRMVDAGIPESGTPNKRAAPQK